MDTNSILMMVQDKLPKDPMSVMNLRDNLDKMSDTKREEFARNLPLMQFKDPTLVFWVGSFLFGGFGVGRFMIGDMLFGHLRLELSLVVYLFFAFYLAFDSTFFLVLYIIAGLGAFAWWVADLFIVGKKIRQQNLDQILKAING